MDHETAGVVGGRILVVCTGNVCRSPYAERRLRAELASTITVSSRGTRALAGEPMDPHVARALEERGHDSSGFAARQLAAADVEEADLVITMSREHRAEVVRLHPRAMARCFALVDLADIAADSGPGDVRPTTSGPTWVAELAARVAARRGHVPPRPHAEATVTDPWGLGPRASARMAREIDAVLPVVVEALTPTARITSRRH